MYNVASFMHAKLSPALLEVLVLKNATNGYWLILHLIKKKSFISAKTDMIGSHFCSNQTKLCNIQPEIKFDLIKLIWVDN